MKYNTAPLFMIIFKWATSVTGIVSNNLFVISDYKWLFVEYVAYFYKEKENISFQYLPHY